MCFLMRCLWPFLVRSSDPVVIQSSLCVLFVCLAGKMKMNSSCFVSIPYFQFMLSVPLCACFLSIFCWSPFRFWEGLFVHAERSVLHCILLLSILLFSYFVVCVFTLFLYCLFSLHGTAAISFFLRTASCLCPRCCCCLGVVHHSLIPFSCSSVLFALFLCAWVL